MGSNEGDQGATAASEPKTCSSCDQVLSALGPISAQLEEIAGRLRRQCDTTEQSAEENRQPGWPASYHVAARRLYALRRRRTEIFGHSELFGEPAWDILLDLFIAHCEGKMVSVSSACIGSAAPATTGLRWLGVLTAEGLIRREADPQDHRRVMVCLTERGLAGMERFFEGVVSPAASPFVRP